MAIPPGAIEAGTKAFSEALAAGFDYGKAKLAQELAIQQAIYGQTTDLAAIQAGTTNTLLANTAYLNQAIASKYSNQRKSLLDNTNSTYLWMAGIAAGAILIAVLIFRR